MNVGDWGKLTAGGKAAYAEFQERLHDDDTNLQRFWRNVRVTACGDVLRMGRCYRGRTAEIVRHDETVALRWYEPTLRNNCLAYSYGEMTGRIDCYEEAARCRTA